MNYNNYINERKRLQQQLLTEQKRNKTLSEEHDKLLTEPDMVLAILGPKNAVLLKRSDENIENIKTKLKDLDDEYHSGDRYEVFSNNNGYEE